MLRVNSNWKKSQIQIHFLKIFEQKESQRSEILKTENICLLLNKIL